MKESATMTFVGWQASDDDDDDDEADVQNWYIDQLFRDLQKDIAEYYNISETAASSKLYTEGLKIYCAMDEKLRPTLKMRHLILINQMIPTFRLRQQLWDMTAE